MADQYLTTNPVTQCTSGDFPGRRPEGPFLDAGLALSGGTPTP